jgi:hypothetical protein
VGLRGVPADVAVADLAELAALLLAAEEQAGRPSG